MREKTFHVYVDSHDRSLLLQSLRILWMVWGGMAVFAIVLYFFERKAVHATYHDGYDASAKGRVQLAEHIRTLPLGFLMSKDCMILCRAHSRILRQLSIHESILPV